MPRVSVVSALVLALAGCQNATGPILAEPCDLSLDDLAGSTWVMLDPTDGSIDVPNAQARGKFFEEDGKLKLKYTAKALGEVYDYTCLRKPEQVVCLQDIGQEHGEAACRAYEADEPGSCSLSKLQEALGESLDEDTLKAARKAAMDEADEAEKAGNWPAFRGRNDNVGNRIQGRVYIRLDAKKCRLRFSDMYMGIYDGRIFEDSNVVGTNPFVKAEAEMLFEACDDGRGLVDLAGPERLDPDAIPGDRAFALGDEVHYHYYGDTAAKAEQGCTYSMDVWAQWKPAQMGLDAPVVDGNVDWHFTHRWSDAQALKLVNPFDPRGVVSVVRYKKCGDGAKEKIDVVCAATKVTVPDEG